MTHKQLVKLLKVEGACSEAMIWIESNRFTLHGAWAACDRSPWMEWIAETVVPPVIRKRALDSAMKQSFTHYLGGSLNYCDAIRKALSSTRLNRYAMDYYRRLQRKGEL